MASDRPWCTLSVGPTGTLYERVGDVPNVAFPCAALTDADGRIAIYYGGADTVVCLAFGYVNEIVDFVKRNSSV